MVKKWLRIVAVLMATATIVSCIDKSYDIDDIDLTLGIGTGNDNVLWLPKSSTSDMILQDFIIIEDEEYITIEKDDNGEDYYCLRGDGEDNMTLLSETGTTRMRILNKTFEPIDLTNPPTTIEEGTIVLDLDNPMIFLEFNNSVPMDIECQLLYKTFKDGKTKEVRPEVFSVPASGTTKFCYVEHTVEQKMLPKPYRNYPEKTLNGFRHTLAETPDSILLEVEEARTKTSSPGIEGNFQTLYHIYTPLFAGEKFAFTNVTIEDNWYEDINMLDNDVKFDVKALRVESDVTSTLPLDLEVTASALDLNGKVIKDILVTPARAASLTTGHISFQLTTKDGKFAQYLNGENRQQLDGIKVITRATGNEHSKTTVLRPTDHIRLTNMRWGLVGGVIIDAN